MGDPLAARYTWGASGSGEIGRHAGFRILCLRACGFKSHLPHSCDESRHSSRRTPRGCAPGGHLFGQYRFSGLIVCSRRTSPVARSVTVTVSAVARMRTLVLAWARPMPSRCIVPALRSVTFPDSSIRSKRIRCGSKPEVSPGVAVIVAV